jgi:hypothetical protein
VASCKQQLPLLLPVPPSLVLGSSRLRCSFLPRASIEIGQLITAESEFSSSTEFNEGLVGPITMHKSKQKQTSNFQKQHGYEIADGEQEQGGSRLGRSKTLSRTAIHRFSETPAQLNHFTCARISPVRLCLISSTISLTSHQPLGSTCSSGNTRKQQSS